MSATLCCLGRVASRALLRKNEVVKFVFAPSSVRLESHYPKDGNIDFTKIDIKELNESDLTDFEISRNPEEWKFVERVLPLKLIPPLPEYDGPFPSGWVPPKEEAKSLPYFIPRTRNNMQPVYLLLRDRGQRKITLIKRIHGDIWKLEKDLKKFLEAESKKLVKLVATKINELSCTIMIRGDHVAYVKKWMNMKGF